MSEATYEQLQNENRALREANRELFEELEKAKAVICELRRSEHGHWIEKPFLFSTSNFCSKCGDYFGMPHGKYKFCPTCGIPMEDRK